jgi:hypothetical protein
MPFGLLMENANELAEVTIPRGIYFQGYNFRDFWFILEMIFNLISIM